MSALAVFRLKSDGQQLTRQSRCIIPSGRIDCTLPADERKLQLQAQPMPVTVTRAAGKLGIPVCRALIEAGYSVRATHKAERHRMRLKLDVADLLDQDACYRLVTAAGAVLTIPRW